MTTEETGWRKGTKEEVLQVVRDFPKGTGVPFIRETLRIPDSTIREYLDKLIKEGLVRTEEGLVFRRPYYWFITYYPVVLPVPEFVHITLVYNKKTEDKQGKGLDVSLTYDFDCRDITEMKDVLKKFLFLKSHSWLDSKFGDRVPIPEKWSEEKERPTNPDIVQLLKSKNLDFTALHYRWVYYREFGNKREEKEVDLEDWEDELSTDMTWTQAKKGRLKLK